MVRKIDEEYRKWGLNINYNKTEYLCVGKEVSNIVINNEIIRKCDSFKYLGTHITSTGTCQKDIDSKIALGKQATKILHGLLWSKNISKVVKNDVSRYSRKYNVVWGGNVANYTKNKR